MRMNAASMTRLCGRAGLIAWWLIAGMASAANLAPTVSITSPSAGTQYNSPASITITANASDQDGSVAKVELFRDGILIGQAGQTQSPYSVAWSNVAAGTYSLTAKATDNAGKATTSSAVQIKVINVTTIITSPAAGAVLGGRTAMVTGSFTGADSTTVIVTALPVGTSRGGNHSVVATSGAGSFSASVDLGPGANNIEVQVARSDGTYEIVQEAVTAIEPPVVVMTGPTPTGQYPVPAQVTLTADAASLQAAIARVEFLEGSTLLGQASQPPYSVGAVFSTTGNHSIFARAIDSYGFPSESSPIVIPVTSAPPTVSITSPVTGARYKAPASITFTASAADPDGQVARVEYYNAGSLIGTSYAPPYSVAWTGVAAGSYSITARAVDDVGTAGESAAVNLTVASNVPPTVTLTSPSGNLTARAPATIGLGADAADPDGAVTKVEFLANGAVVGTVTSAPYQYTWNAVDPGSYSITARATDDNGLATTSGAISVTVAANAVPTISLTSPAGGSSFDAPASIAISASASDADGSVAVVEFFADGSLIGTSTSAPYTMTWSKPSLGTHTLSARATDNEGASSVSAPLSISVAGITATITAPASGSTYVAPADFTIQATVATSSGSITSIEFFDGASLIQTTAIPAGYSNVTVSQTLVGVIEGTHLYTVRGHDDGGRVGTSEGVSVVVSAPPTPPSISLTSPTPGSFYLTPAAIKIGADAVAGTYPISKVEFFAGSALIGSANSPPYSMIWSSATAGTYTLTATATDTNGSQAVSTELSITVANAAIITIDEGINLSTVHDDTALVTGSLISDGNTGVSVNGITAVVDETGHWAANRVPLISGANPVTCQATTIDGVTTSASVSIAREGSNPITLLGDTEEGIAPYQVNFVITNRGEISIKKIELDAVGDGQLQDITPIGLVFSVQYPSAGQYVARVKVTALDNAVYEARFALTSHSASALYQRAQDVFAQLLTRLQTGDVDHAMNRVSAAMRDEYRSIFDTLSNNGMLASSAAEFGTVQEGAMANGLVELLVIRQAADGYDGYWIYLIKGPDGVWRVETM